jgi:hypothetical protein
LPVLGGGVTLSVALFGCSLPPEGVLDGGRPLDGSAGVPADAGAGPGNDAARSDVTVGSDAETPADTASDTATSDAGGSDAGGPDGAGPDAAGLDAGGVDGAGPDGGPADAGGGDGGDAGSGDSSHVLFGYFSSTTAESVDAIETELGRKFAVIRVYQPHPNDAHLLGNTPRQELAGGQRLLASFHNMVNGSTSIQFADMARGGGTCSGIPDGNGGTTTCDALLTKIGNEVGG